MVEVRVFATFRIGRQRKYELDVCEYPTPADVCRFLGIPVGDVAILLINGFHSKVDVPLKDGDVVSLFPPCAGG